MGLNEVVVCVPDSGGFCSVPRALGGCGRGSIRGAHGTAWQRGGEDASRGCTLTAASWPAHGAAQRCGGSAPRSTA